MNQYFEAGYIERKPGVFLVREPTPAIPAEVPGVTPTIAVAEEKPSYISWLIGGALLLTTGYLIGRGGKK